MTEITQDVRRRVEALLDRSECGEKLSVPARAVLANLFTVYLETGAVPEDAVLRMLPRTVGVLLADLLALPRGATMLAIGVGAPRALLPLDDAVKLTVIEHEEVAYRTLAAALRHAAVFYGPIANYAAEDAFDYALAGIGDGRMLTAAGDFYQFAAAGGSIPSAVAAVELAVRSIRPGGFIALVGTRAAFRTLGTLPLRAWLANRVREVALFSLPPDEGRRLQLALFEKRAGLPFVEPVCAVIPWLPARNIVIDWRCHCRARRIAIDEYAASCRPSEAPAGLTALAAPF